MGAFTAWWSSARFGWGRVWSSAAVSTEPFPAPLLGEVGGLRGLQADRGPLRSPPRGSRRRGPGPGAPRPASTSLNPRARLLEVRARGLSDDLAGRGTFSRVTRRARGPGRAGTTGPGTGAGSATALGRGGRFWDGASRARVGSDPGLHGGAHPAPRHARQGLQGPACVMRAQCDRIHPTSRRASSA